MKQITPFFEFTKIVLAIKEFLCKEKGGKIATKKLIIYTYACGRPAFFDSLKGPRQRLGPLWFLRFNYFVITTCELPSTQSTFAPSFSAINLTGVYVLSFLMNAGLSSLTSSPLT